MSIDDVFWNAKMCLESSLEYIGTWELPRTWLGLLNSFLSFAYSFKKLDLSPFGIEKCSMHLGEVEVVLREVLSFLQHGTWGKGYISMLGGSLLFFFFLNEKHQFPFFPTLERTVPGSFKKNDFNTYDKQSGYHGFNIIFYQVGSQIKWFSQMW